MRIIAGKYKGIVLESPIDQKIRPTSDRTKEAVFSSIDANYGITGANILDTFCGSGALGLESLSRGAENVYMMDIDTKLATINSSKLKDEEVNIIACDVLNPITSSTVMDFIFIDPPYQMQAGSKAIKSLLDSGWANKETIFIVETDKDDNSINEEDYSYYNKKKYGKTIIYYLKA